MTVINVEERLRQRGVKPTAIRELVLKALWAENGPVSLSHLENILETIDKSTLFRTLSLFEKHRVVHTFEDGSGALKYEACRNPNECRVEDQHIHFFCTRCNQTYCLPSMRIPIIKLPEGFCAEGINYTVKGLCPHCSQKA